MHNLIKIAIMLFLMNNISFGFNVRKITQVMENTLNRKSEERWVEIINGVFDSEDNFWLSWCEWDKMPKDWELVPKGFVPYIYWYIQKFDAEGTPLSPAIEKEKGKFYADGGFGGYGLFPGSAGDCYFFPSGGYVGRIDENMNMYVTDKVFRSLWFSNFFMDKKGTMYIVSTTQNLIACTKAKIQQPLPIFVEEQSLPGWDKPDGYKYDWVHSKLIYFEPSGNSGIFILPPLLKRIPWADTTTINVYRVSLPDLISVDTSSFRISDALFKKIRGCKLRTEVLTSRGRETRWIAVQSLVEGNGDTLMLYLSSRGGAEDLIYVCKLTKNGEPIKSKEIIEEEVEDFDKAPEKLHKEIIFRGTVIGRLGEPTGIMFYGFDKSGNVYYHVWDKSDDYWRE